MDDFYQICLLRPRRVERSLQLPEVYEVPRWKWLGWLLRQVGLLKPSTYIDCTETYERVVIDERKVIDLLHKFTREMSRIDLRRKIESLQLSYEALDEIADHMAQRGPWPIELRAYRGIRIVVNPYLEQHVLPVFKED